MSNNTVVNINNNYAGTAATGQVCGITISGTGNNYRQYDRQVIHKQFQNAGIHAAAAVVGTCWLRGNGIAKHNFRIELHRGISVSVNAIGIYCTGVNVPVSRNLVHGMTAASSAATLAGIVVDGSICYNNMVRLGLDTSGVSLTTPCAIFGLSDASSTANNQFYFNSIYIGGSGIGGSNNSFAFNGTGTTHVIRDNIFYNGRSNGAGTGKHYAMTVSGSTVNPGGLTSDNNLCYANGTGGMTGLFNGADCMTIQAWCHVTGQDSASGYGDPLFINPTAATPNLHVQASNSVEGAGVAIAAVTTDFDGQTRSTLTPTDVGADAGNFTVER